VWNDVAGAPRTHFHRSGAASPEAMISYEGKPNWLLGEGVTLVGMEATGAYWKPVFYLLEHDIECWLLNARHMKAVPGGKTDVKDAGVDRPAH
jgi:transposase